MKRWFRHPWQESVARTGFFTSVISYGIFLALDLARPGFVSRAFSVHLFLLAAILFGAWWSSFADAKKPRSVLTHLLSALFALLAAVLVWNLGETLGDLRGLFAVLAFLAVIYLVRILQTI